MSKWPKFVLFLVIGYLTMSRSFAYLGFPPARLFIGEISIAAFLLSRPRAVLDRWLAAIARPSALSAFAIALAVFVAYGIFETVHGWAAHYPTILVIESFAFHYYPLCFFMGLWASEQDPMLLVRTIRCLAWVNGIYGLFYIAFLNRVALAVPGAYDVSIFSQPTGASIAILGLLCFEPKLARVWHLLLINLLVMLGLLVRAEYLGFVLGLLVWATLARRFDRLLAGFAAIAVLFTLAVVTDFRIPAPSTRGGEISAQAIFARIVAPADPELAAEYTRDRDARSQAGTATWRTNWWHAIWETVHEKTESAVFGEGYGYPIAGLVGYRQRELRSPHSVFFYALAYGGWVGVVIFFALQTALCQVLWRSWQIGGNPFGLIIWIVICTAAFFGNSYETPFGAIPFYLLTGMAASPLLRNVRRVPLSPVTITNSRMKVAYSQARLTFPDPQEL